MPTIVVVSHDPHLADVRRYVLETAGFTVITSKTFLEVEAACKGSVSLMVIGYSLPPSERRRVVSAARQHCQCDTPILQLAEDGRHELTKTGEETRFDNSPCPDDFLAAVKFALGQS